MNDNHSIADLCGCDFEQFWKDYKAHKEELSETYNLSAKIIAPVGVLLNVVLLLVVVRLKSMWTIINVYLANLAVADTLYLLLTLAISWGHLYMYFLWSHQVSIVIGCVFNTLRIESYLLVVAVAVERFSAVHHPITYRASASKTRAAKVSAGLWVLAVGVGIVDVFSFNIQVGPDVLIPQTVSVVILGSFSLVSVVVTGTLYVCLVLKLRQRSPEAQHCPQRLGKVTCMLIINTAVFFLLNSLQFTSIVMIGIFISSPNISAVPKLLHDYMFVETCTRILEQINSCIDPIIYSVINADYRAAVIQAMTCLCCDRQGESALKDQMLVQVELLPKPALKNQIQDLTAELPESVTKDQIRVHAAEPFSETAQEDQMRAQATKLLQEPAPKDQMQVGLQATEFPGSLPKDQMTAQTAELLQEPAPKDQMQVKDVKFLSQGPHHKTTSTITHSQLPSQEELLELKVISSVGKDD